MAKAQVPSLLGSPLLGESTVTEGGVFYLHANYYLVA